MSRSTWFGSTSTCCDGTGVHGAPSSHISLNGGHAQSGRSERNMPQPDYAQLTSRRRQPLSCASNAGRARRGLPLGQVQLRKHPFQFIDQRVEYQSTRRPASSPADVRTGTKSRKGLARTGHSGGQLGRRTRRASASAAREPGWEGEEARETVMGGAGTRTYARDFVCQLGGANGHRGL